MYIDANCTFCILALTVWLYESVNQRADMNRLGIMWCIHDQTIIDSFISIIIFGLVHLSAFALPFAGHHWICLLLLDCWSILDFLFTTGFARHYWICWSILDLLVTTGFTGHNWICWSLLEGFNYLLPICLQVISIPPSSQGNNVKVRIRDNVHHARDLPSLPHRLQLHRSLAFVEE